MKNTLARVFLILFATTSLLLTFCMPAQAEKIWMSSTNGLWSNGANWSGKTPPDITSFIRITNGNSKTIIIDASTAPANLTVQALSITAPPGATNTVLLSGLGLNNPLVFQTGLEMLDGSVIRITNSALQTWLTNDHVNLDGTLVLDSGSLDLGDTTVTARVGRVTSGTLIINGGNASAGAVTIGGLTNSSGFLNLNGGTLNIAAFLSVGRSLGTTGSLSMTGGQLNVPNGDTRVGDDGIGQMTVSNAAATLNNLQVGRDTFGNLTLQPGAAVHVLGDTTIGRFSGASGTLTLAGGQLLAEGQRLFVGRGGTGQMTLSSGAVLAASLLLAADSTNSIGAHGTLSVAGGSLTLNSNLLVGGALAAAGQVSLTGGTASVTNAAGSALLEVSSGSLELNGGTLDVDRVELTNSAGQIAVNHGTLSTKGTVIANGSPFVVGDGISPATLHLNGGTHTFAQGLVISKNATLSGCGTIIGAIVNQGTIATNCGGSTLVGPALTTAPQSQTVTVAGTVTFTVVASGTQPLFYQWQFGGTNLAGATGSSYTKGNIQPADAGSYDVVISNQVGSVTSPAAMLSVLAPPSPTVRLNFQNLTSQGALLSFPSKVGQTYSLQYKDLLADPAWTEIPPVTNGTGSQIFLPDNTATGLHRFYRLKVQ